jgi:hypothetical protein
MSVLLTAVGLLFLAVIGHALLQPWQSSDPVTPEDAEDHARMMQHIANSIF